MGGLKTSTVCLLCWFMFLPLHVLLPLLESKGRARWTQCWVCTCPRVTEEEEKQDWLKRPRAQKKRDRTFASGSIVCRRGILGIIGNVYQWGGAAGLSVTCNEVMGEQQKKGRRGFTEAGGVFPKSVCACFNPRITN